MAEKQSLAQAYVQIIPTADGIGGKLGQIFDNVGEGLGSKLSSIIKTAIAGVGIAKLIQSSIAEGANLEQSIGGIETLYKESANKMIQYANEAYKTAGLSANDYMQTATSYAAALVSSLGGNTEEASRIANQAIIDMSDNANKMGTDMQSIQNAYQGFAKQNYTMLDNLKLGYGGTKTEMQRLLSDAQALTGVKYDISNLNDVYEAIHVIQNELGITGTTALEAESTISGSINMVKASISNVLGTLTTGGDIQNAINGLIDSVISMTSNLGKAIITIISTLPEAVLTAVSSIGQLLKENWENASELVTNAISESLPHFLEKGYEVLTSIIDGIANNLPEIMATIGTMLGKMLKSLIDNLPQFIEIGSKIVQALISGIAKLVSSLVKSMGELVSKMWNEIANTNWLQLGKNIMLGLANGIANAIGTVVQKVGEACSSIYRKVTSFFGIHSPSRKMAWVGEMLDEGLAGGIEDNSTIIDKAVGDLNETINPSLQGEILSTMAYDGARTYSSSNSTASSSDRLASLLENGQIVVVLDSGEMVGALTPRFDEAFGQLQLRKARG